MKMHYGMRLLSLSLLIYLSTTASGDPVFPKLRDMAESFESNVELTDLIQETTALAKEYYNFEDKTGRLEVLASGIWTKYFIYGKPPGQVFEVNDTACTELDAGIVEIDTNFYGWISKEPMYVGPSALILTRENDAVQYVQQENVRGIRCDWFRLEVTEKGKNVTLDYYFSVPEWDMPYRQDYKKEQPFPVRIKVTHGADEDYNEQMIDFLYFRPRFSDKSKFQPPVGLGCWMKEPTVQLPNIPEQYDFSAEVFNLFRDSKHTDTDITTARVWYDYTFKYARLDMYTSSGKVSDFYDFNSGVRYHMVDDRTCIFKTMRNSFFLNIDENSLIGQMKEPAEVLNLHADKHDFYSMGQADVRGIRCNVYEKVERNCKFFEVKYAMLVTTVYFSTEMTKTQVDGEDLDFSPPIEIIITGYNDLKKVIYKRQFQIFSFDDEPGREFVSTFPSEECFAASDQKTHFAIKIDAPEEIVKELEGKDYEFNNLARNTIITTANITEFRLTYLRTDFTESGVYLIGVMLDRPPILYNFWKMFDEPTFVTTAPAYKIDFEDADEESCAAACLAYAEPCKGFHFCGRACFLSLGDISEEEVNNNPINADCYIYIRAVSDSVNNQASLEKAIDNLITAKEQKKLEFRASIKGSDEFLLATDIITSYSGHGGDDVNNYPYILVKAGFQFKKASVVKTTVEILDAETEQDCYRRCKESTDISCSSFSYCAKASNKMCYISSVLLTDDPRDLNETDQNAECNIFSLQYLDFFDIFPNRVLTIPGYKSVKDVYSTENCAKICKDEPETKCRGFEYCKSERACTLHTTHVLDLKPGETTSGKPSCIHYSAKFIADYRNMGSDLIDNENVGRRESLTLEECARSCSEELPICNSFSYCPPSQPGMTDSSCSMTTMKLYNADKRKTKDECRLYTKRDNVGDWNPKAPTSTSGYTKGGFAGLAIGMIILGLVIGMLLFVSYSFYRSRTGGGDGLTVKFSKQEDT